MHAQGPDTIVAAPGPDATLQVSGSDTVENISVIPDTIPEQPAPGSIETDSLFMQQEMFSTGDTLLQTNARLLSQDSLLADTT
ncbi:MAG: hypothetical protein RQ746_09260, partial [Bacteroidales bacterium]|nr:hypothetical protein [Bacteroidales bacterium]